MLPSAGYFKTLLCPYFNENDSCSRPFCHYKHENNRKPVETSVKKSKSEGMQFRLLFVQYYLWTSQDIDGALK